MHTNFPLIHYSVYCNSSQGLLSSCRVDWISQLIFCFYSCCLSTWHKLEFSEKRPGGRYELFFKLVTYTGTQTIVECATYGNVVLGYLRKQAEQVSEGQTCKAAFGHSLFFSSCLDFLPWLPSNTDCDIEVWTK